MLYKSRRGVYYNLSFSTYKCDVHGFEFYFSSQCNLKRFLDRYEQDIEKINTRLTVIYGTKINQDLSLLITYKNVEKRGFRIKSNKGVEYRCLEDLILNLNLTLSLREQPKS